MRIINLLLIFGLTFALLGCKGKLKEEVISFDNGKPHIIRLYREKGKEKLVEKETKFYSNGNKEVEGEFRNGKRHGKWTYWYNTGQVWSEGSYFEGENDMNRVVYHPNGKISQKGRYNKGLFIDQWEYFNEEGVIVKKVVYDNKGNIVSQEDLNRPLPYK